MARSQLERHGRIDPQPAGLCGIVGMSQVGRVSRYEWCIRQQLGSSWSVWTVGRRCALLLESIGGTTRDTTSLNYLCGYSKSVNQPLANLRIGWVREHFALA